MERKCLDCGALLFGRSDKKFCDDSCRTNYNNRRNSGESSYLRKVNSILKRNRKILETLNPKSETTVKWRTLISEGFNFDFITDMYETTEGVQYRFCYEYGYSLLDNDEVLLVKRKE
ncbi:hypothetical protein GCM10007415_02000 [Parapedobacter pyrenivorans]|uniref:DUF2116 family Zn-ribbon domain-containing protein n=1 Tax=Parapedobacter pyrenivorans TaxID=1305674 RepID=A0A917HC75_9SPHI|nr:hypothetical protein [Parapedobacter pyrenivorans]GGG74169.1 hypothetical protein GCM10007415_02000 [Parapedobacter pyrenivorans]